MRTNWDGQLPLTLLCVCLAVLLAPTAVFAQKESSDLQLKQGVITIRALADRQRKIEEAEFLNRLNPSSNLPAGPQVSLRPSGNSGSAAAPGYDDRPMDFSQQAGQGGIPNMQGVPFPPVQELPAIRSNQAGKQLPNLQVQEVERPAAANTVLSVYGQEGKLTVEVALKGGEIARYRVGDQWSGHLIKQISREGVSVTKIKGGENERLIPVGGTL